MENLIAPCHVSIDCVVFGFDGERLNVLLLRRYGEDQGSVFHDMKLPGSLIYQDENLDEAASRVLTELTGLKRVALTQFRAYGSKDRTRDPKDVHWLERAQQTKVERIVTVAFFALTRISRMRPLTQIDSCWVPIDEVPALAFDHNTIIKDSLNYLRSYVPLEPSSMFRLLPPQFTISQLRKVYNAVTGEQIDARNFYKKLKVMSYVVPSKYKETGVAHRAARLFNFDTKTYNKYRIYSDKNPGESYTRAVKFSALNKVGKAYFALKKHGFRSSDSNQTAVIEIDLNSIK